MDIMLSLHSRVAYVVLFTLVLAVLNAFWGLLTKRAFGSRNLRISLFGLIFSHIQLLLGLGVYFVSPYFSAWENGMGAVMKDATLRLFLVEHPITNILAIVLITMGWSLHKKVASGRKKFFRIAVFYGIGTLLLISRIPWDQWL
ncbi:MAG: hypothetical protein P8H25_07270 [Flavobacteriaceae bacterium]|nr:hypothetical protein [Flavobacteriaceae bacterium]